MALEGHLVGNYLIGRKLGEGGMGMVYEAVDQVVGDRVAVKILRPEARRSEAVAARFFNEVRALHRLNHPGTVAIRDVGHLPDETAFLVMEYLEGETLKQRTERYAQEQGRLPHQEALHIVWQLAGTLAAAHEKGIIHRDLKPDNVMLVPDAATPGGERVKLLDFGIAKLGEVEGEVGRGDITGAGGVMGTPAYMSPEQCRGEGMVTERSDVYALGVLCYELLAGQKPYRGEGAGELIGQHLYATPRPLAELAPEVMPEVIDLVRRMMAKQPESRPRMREVAEMLRYYGASLLLVPRAQLSIEKSGERGAVRRAPSGGAAALSSPAPPALRSGPLPAVSSSGALGLSGRSPGAGQRAFSGQRSTSGLRGRRRGARIAGAVLAGGLVLAALAALYWLISSQFTPGTQ